MSQTENNKIIEEYKELYKRFMDTTDDGLEEELNAQMNKLYYQLDGLGREQLEIALTE
jgi:hypothetical protein